MFKCNNIPTNLPNNNNNNNLFTLNVKILQYLYNFQFSTFYRNTYKCKFIFKSNPNKIIMNNWKTKTVKL